MFIIIQMKDLPDMFMSLCIYNVIWAHITDTAKDNSIYCLDLLRIIWGNLNENRKHYQAVEKHPSASLCSSFVIATYGKVRLIPHDFARLASGCF